jgi:hypothetical protein
VSTAKSEKITLQPVTVSSDEQASMDNLKGLSGPAFDQAYMQAETRGHQKTIDALTNAQSQLPAGSKVSVLVTSTLPKLQEHQRMADRISANMPSSERMPAGQNQGQMNQGQMNQGQMNQGQTPQTPTQRDQSSQQNQ